MSLTVMSHLFPFPFFPVTPFFLSLRPCDEKYDGHDYTGAGIHAAPPHAFYSLSPSICVHIKAPKYCLPRVITRMSGILSTFRRAGFLYSSISSFHSGENTI